MNRKIYIYIFILIISFQPIISGQVIPQEKPNPNDIEIVEAKLDSAVLIIQNLRNSDPKEGIEIGLEVLATINYSSNTKNLARLFDEMGISFRKLGEYNLAVKYHFESLKIFKEIQDSMGQAFTLHNIGNVYRLLNQYDIALEHFFESVKIKRVINDLYQISFSLNSIGLVYEEKGMVDSAEIYMKQALDIAVTQDDNMNLANIYSNLGNVAFKAKNYGEAKECLLKALKLYKTGIANYGIAQALARLAAVYMKTNEFEKALYNLNAGFIEVKSLHAKDLEKDYYYLFSEYYKNTGNYKKSTDYLEKHIGIINDLSNENKIKQITQSEFVYHIGEKVRENELLRKSNEIYELKYSNQKIILLFSLAFLIITFVFIIVLLHRNRKIKYINLMLSKREQTLNKLNSDLEGLNSTQKKFFSIIAHDLRNPFNFLILSSSMILEKYGNLKEEEKIELLNGIETVSKESYTLLSNLLEWSKLQTGKFKANKINLSLKESTERNIALLCSLAKQKDIKIKDTLKDSITVYADQQMVDTVLRNLINNSIKFSKKGDVITISATESESKVTVCVEDEGIGMDDEMLKNLFNLAIQQNRAGTNNESGSGIGLLICKELVEENNGRIWAESEINSGTKFFFTLNKI